MARQMSDRQQIAAGCFFTEAELAAKPHLRRLATVTPAGHVDPNTRAVSAEARKLAEGNGVCAYCYEPGDDRSALVEQADHSFRHPECQEAWDAELAARRES
jgi:hypothetical protein